MQITEGRVINNLHQDEVIDYLKSKNTQILEIFAKDITVNKQNNYMMLLIKDNGRHNQYPLRKSFLHKLLKWYNISSHSINHFSDETLLSICNDNLRAIANKHKKILIKIENNEVVSIVSKYFTFISDLEVLKLAKKSINISSVSRDDFCMRIYTEIRSEAEPIVNDVCGFGLNITNSETGFSSLSAEHYILRYWCSNGATTKIKGKSINIVHYNQNKHTLLENLSSVLDEAPMNPAGFMEGVKRSLQIRADSLFPTITYKVNTIIGSSKGYGFFYEFDKKNKSKYDLFNHITHSAKKFSILEKYKLEQLAGSLIC